MGPVAPILAVAATIATTAASAGAFSGGSPKINIPPPIQNDDASATLSANDAIAKRRGGASDILNGDAGFTQQLPGPKAVLGA